jgi:hypothetical protein
LTRSTRTAARPLRDAGRCAIEVEERAGQPVRHEPAITLAQRDIAHAAATGGTTWNQHSLADCPVRQ